MRLSWKEARILISSAVKDNEFKLHNSISDEYKKLIEHNIMVGKSLLKVIRDKIGD